MQNYSENWRHLKSILAGYTTENKRHQIYSYSDHVEAKALSIFLAHANLATPKLDRKTVAAVLAGQQRWPNDLGTNQFEGVSLSLSLLEEYGLVAFYAGWCTVHCKTPRNLDGVDPSLTELIRAIEHLKEISSGHNGYIRPHYRCLVSDLERQLETDFGGKPIVELLPNLCIEDDHFMLPPGDQNFSSLVSTYLWLVLRESFEPKETFARWILCLRVNCNWGMPILFDYLEPEEQYEFNRQLITYLAQDEALSLPIETLQKQSLNETEFSNIISPFRSNLHVTIDTEGNGSSEQEEIVQLEKLTLRTLNTAYPTYNTDDFDDLQFVQQMYQFRHSRGLDVFYISMLVNAIENSIRIDGQVLISSGISDELLELATSRPILKHLMLNLLPKYDCANYLIWLLSRPATCDIGLFYLTQQSFASAHRDSHSFIQHFDKGYHQVVCHEYLRTIEEEFDSGERLLRIVELLGNRCRLQKNDFPKSSEYQLLLCLLDSLKNQQAIQIGQAFIHSLTMTATARGYQTPKNHWYLVGFWLFERLEGCGIVPTGTLIPSLKKAFLNYYKVEFTENLAGGRHNLEPSVFFAALPWHKLIGSDEVNQLLTISSNCSDWQAQLSYSNKNNVAFGAAVRQYLQILICVGRPQRNPKYWERVAYRVAEIVRTLGFGPREQATYLFDVAFYENKYDLWPQICSYTNLFQESLYDDFFERCVHRIPLDQLFVLLEHCPVIARAQKLQDVIASKQQSETGDLGLASLEKAFISAWNSGHTILASKLIGVAKEYLSDERFAKSNNHHILSIRRAWLSYEFEWQLVTLLDELKHNPDEFAESASQIPLPHGRQGDAQLPHDERAQAQRCERFRRYIIAAAYCDSAPEKCVRIMDALHKETGDHNHSFLLFNGRLAVLGNGGDTTQRRHALLQFLLDIRKIEPEHMSPQWISKILETYRQLHDTLEIDAFWMKLTLDQQARVEILRPYCLALIARGEALIAQQITLRYCHLNPQTPEGLGLNDLIDEISKALPRDLSVSQLVQVINEESQRNVVQLTKHYSQIVSKEFEDYVAIVGQGQQPHEYLKNVVLEIAHELLLRKKNLQIHSKKPRGKKNVRITNEDLINDWFTSLFDKRMAEARVGLRDQKRGGQSTSGKSPGEVDGYITDAKNNRIAIFEAFRLFFMNTTVISEHLDKIFGYDNESLSPVFIIAYCDVSNFSALVPRYAKFIATKEYIGYTRIYGAYNTLDVLRSTDSIWVGMERRRRNHHDVVFYHMLLNMSTKEKLTL
ncbi:hypothetical protein IGS59_27550 [Janthinobacterium sp. GW460P]|uniref:hypothetical protein n=1 Tax=unclassified Janthinobacterium TaxID=2610881 RepID=UPI00111C882A|nr:MULTISPECIES: hypothetical protein [unclassified Janthinobacterium]MCC7706007.1 hypothetical protein [Janthinobacterium sp. GW460P]MCC7711509.1 hypothetical protein [Janthinobacterium sp. GW460W]